jgi:cysteine synthase
MMKDRVRYKTIDAVLESRQDIKEFMDSEAGMQLLFDLPSSIPKARVALYKKLYVGIGNTSCYTVPLPNDNLLHIKMEYANGMGNNHYSRCWIPYLFIAETLGVIVPEETHLLEVTSGSAGISLSMAAKYLGYELTLVIPEELPVGRTAPMEYYGATLVRVSGYIGSCIKEMRRLLVKSNYFPCNHSEENADLLVKIDKRIAIEYRAAYGTPDYCIIGLGNGTSTYAIFDYWRSFKKQPDLVTYHPDLTKPGVVFGLYTSNVNLRHIEPALSMATERLYTSEMDMIRKMFCFDTEISNLGESSLYAIFIVLEKAKHVSGKTFFTIGYDKKDRYE